MSDFLEKCNFTALEVFVKTNIPINFPTLLHTNLIFFSLNRQELIKKCEQYIKLQEEIEQTRFSIESLTVSPKRKRKKNSKYDDEAFTSYNPPETENIIENQTIDVKEVILAAQETEQVYYR